VIQCSAAPGSQTGRLKLSPKPHGTPISTTQSVISSSRMISAMAHRKLRLAWNVASMVIIPSFMERPEP